MSPWQKIRSSIIAITICKACLIKLTAYHLIGLGINSNRISTNYIFEYLKWFISADFRPHFLIYVKYDILFAYIKFNFNSLGNSPSITELDFLDVIVQKPSIRDAKPMGKCTECGVKIIVGIPPIWLSYLIATIEIYILIKFVKRSCAWLTNVYHCDVIAHVWRRSLQGRPCWLEAGYIDVRE